MSKRKNGINAEPKGVVQLDRELDSLRHRRTGKPLMISENILRLAQAEYEHQYGTRQDYERMQERHGMSIFEVVIFLADYVERLGGKPTEPRPDKPFGKDGES